MLFHNTSIQGPIPAGICWHTNKGITVPLSQDNNITNVILKNYGSAPRLLAVSAVAINMR